MPTAQINGVNLYFEMTGEGFPVFFSHEFAGDHRSWEGQVRFFSRHYRVITYNHRGYPPSEVPVDPEAYSQDAMVRDLHELLKYLEVDRAHIVGLSMGASASLAFAHHYPDRCASLVLASCGTGSLDPAQYVRDVEGVREVIERLGMQRFATTFARGPTRIQLLRKDPRVWAAFCEQLAEQPALGMSLTLRGVQLRRPTLFSLESALRELTVPTLILVGDEDEPCLEPSLFLKRTLPSAGLVCLPQTGHTVNLEEPVLFNAFVQNFFALVERGKWSIRVASA